MMSFKLALATVVCVGAVLWFVIGTIEPELVARVEITETAILVTNVTHEPWLSPVFILNDTSGGPQMVVKDRWSPGEKRSLPLGEFVYSAKKQRFDPTFARIEKITISAEGFASQSFTREPGAASPQLAKFFGKTDRPSALIIVGHDP